MEKYNNTKAVLLALMMSIMLTGCKNSRNEPAYTVTEAIQNMDDFDLLKDKNKQIILTKDAMGNEKVSFVQRICLADLINRNRRKEFKDSEIFQKYHQVGIYQDNTFLYFDILDDSKLISVEYIKNDRNLLKADVKEVSYVISEIEESNIAYNFAVLFFGDKETYSRDEMMTLIKLLNDTKEVTLSSNNLDEKVLAK